MKKIILNCFLIPIIGHVQKFSLNNLSHVIDHELKVVYRDYAYIPGISLALVYQL